jgi:hypothetical protein
MTANAVAIATHSMVSGYALSIGSISINNRIEFCQSVIRLSV